MKFQQSTKKEHCPLSLMEDLVTQELGSETLIYSLKTNKAFCLNATTAQVWKVCDGKRSVPEISRMLSKEHRADISEDIVWLALEQLKKNELLADSEEFSIDFQGLSRREMIRKAGLATMVALPTIASMVAPAAAHAASGASGGTNGACTSNCLTGVCSCSPGAVTCSPGHLVNATVNLGLCVNVGVAVSALGVNVNAGVNGNVCLIVAACLL